MIQGHGPQLLLRESSRGWVCLGPVSARGLAEVASRRGIEEVLIVDSANDAVVSTVDLDDLRFLAARAPPGDAPLRQKEVERIARGIPNDARLAPEPEAASAVLVIHPGHRLLRRREPPERDPK